MQHQKQRQSGEYSGIGASARRLSLLATFFFLVLGSGIAQAETFYKWKDSEGVWVYGAHPPNGVEAIVVKTNASRGRSEDDSEGDESAEPAVTANTGPSAEKRAAYCKQGRDNLEALSSDDVIHVRDADGNISELSDEDRKLELEKAQMAVDKYCETAEAVAEG